MNGWAEHPGSPADLCLYGHATLEVVHRDATGVEVYCPRCGDDTVLPADWQPDEEMICDGPVPD